MSRLVKSLVHLPSEIERGIRLRRNIARERRRWSAAQDMAIGPVVSYGHPKTATTAIYKAMSETTGVAAFHAHVARPMHFTTRRNNMVPPLKSGICPEDQPPQWAIADGAARGDRVHFISLARDPLAVNVSWLFFGLQRWFSRRRNTDPAEISAEMIESFFHSSFPHDGILNWFDEEWSKVTGFETRELGEVRERGFLVREHENIRACVMSAHDSDEAKSRTIADFLSLKPEQVGITRRNLGSDRRSSEVYERLKKSIARDKDYRDRMYDSEYARTFFTKRQIDGFHDTWNAIADD
ncbi:MAG: putative capsular polysaccharide synthesis family protein [Phycisphaerales bacterium]|nr:putative capsular polysaccharide synthesis family protein [Phycisphaerales bacterium]